MRKIPHPIGNVFGRLTVVEFSRVGGPGRYFYNCVCECGEKREVREDCLKSGNTKSCGCLYDESRGEASKTHGMWNTRTYRIWRGIKGRCGSNKYKKSHLYFDKGIKVCDRWNESFSSFLEDMGTCPPGHSIDRINGNMGYEPKNCRWATPTEQANNTTRNVIIEMGGRSMTIAQWSRETGIRVNTLVYRIRRGWSSERALLTPTQRHKK